MERISLLNSLRGQQLRVPNLKPRFAHWPEGHSPQYEQLVPVVDRKLESLVKDPEKLKKLKLADFALFTCHWWPLADFERSCTATYLVIWLFLWDDEIDDSGGSLTNEFDGSQTYRAQTTQFVEQCLGLRDHGLAGRDLHPFISSFEPIGDALRAAFDPLQAQRFMDEMLVFMNASENEQRLRLDGTIMDVETYWRVRLGTSAVGVCSAVIEYLNHSALSREVAKSPDMIIIWNETNVIVSIVNDILSLKKELRKDGIDSLIPLTVAAGKSMQEALDSACSDLDKSIARFDDAAKRLQHKFGTDQETHNDTASYWSFFTWFWPRASQRKLLERQRRKQALDAFLETSRQNCTGNLTWSLKTSRYGVASSVQDDGTILFSF